LSNPCRNEPKETSKGKTLKIVDAQMKRGLSVAQTSRGFPYYTARILFFYFSA